MPRKLRFEWEVSAEDSHQPCVKREPRMPRFNVPEHA